MGELYELTREGMAERGGNNHRSANFVSSRPLDLEEHWFSVVDRPLNQVVIKFLSYRDR